MAPASSIWTESASPSFYRPNYNMAKTSVMLLKLQSDSGTQGVARKNPNCLSNGFVNRRNLTVGVMPVDQVALRVYGVVKTVADCCKHSNKIGLDVAFEALKDDLAQRKSTADNLWRFARMCRVANVMRP